jgi:two-component system phosphate regulon response regulator PhoB/two-component system alkaline phosphatase synthesis response regulator PhoP/two-component system response regulator VicR
MNKKAEILLVDDDPDIRDSLQIILESKNFEVRTAANGREAKAALEQKLPDIMILDVMMASDTEGFDLAYELQEKPGFKDLPIIMLTSFLNKVRQEGPGPFEFILGEQWPAHWLFEKPVDTKKLLAKIESILSGA